MTPTELTDRALLELACGADEALKSAMEAAAFRRALLLAGYGHTDTSEIPEDVWNEAIDRSLL